MDDIWFTRLVAYVKQGLGDAEISIENLSQITVLVMEFVDSFVSTVSSTMSATEKHLLAVTWIDKLVFQYCNGKKLQPDVAKLNTEYISRLCEVSKGKTKLNGADTKIAPKAAKPKLGAAPAAGSAASVATAPAVDGSDAVEAQPELLVITPIKKKRVTRFGCMSSSETD